MASCTPTSRCAPRRLAWSSTTPHPPRCSASTGTGYRACTQSCCSATPSGLAWPKWTSFSPKRSHGPTGDWPPLPRSTWAVPARRWRTPNVRSQRAVTPSGRWCWRPPPTPPTPIALTRKAAGRSGPTRTYRQARRWIRPRRSPRSWNASPPGSPTSSSRRAASRPPTWPITTPTTSAVTSGWAATGGAGAARADAAGQPVVDADPQGLPVLVGDSARRRGARHGRLLRGPHSVTPRIRRAHAGPGAR